MEPQTLLETIAAHRQRLLTAWRGGSPSIAALPTDPWDEVVREYLADPVGAPRDQLRDALAAVADWARSVSPADPALEVHLASLVPGALAEIGPEQGARAGLSALFANATANAGWWASKAGEPRRVWVARCPGCGASQQRALAFTCAFCGGALYPKEEP